GKQASPETGKQASPEAGKQASPEAGKQEELEEIKKAFKHPKKNDVPGYVEFNKDDQVEVNLKDFKFKQNPDGSMTFNSQGDQFIVAADNTLTIVRQNGKVETHKPEVRNNLVDGSTSLLYRDAGLWVDRKHDPTGKKGDYDTGVTVM